MRRVLATKAGRIVLGIILTIAFLALVGWQLMRPKIGHATLEEIRSVVPPALLVERKLDEASAKRMDRIGELSVAIVDPDYTKLAQTSISLTRPGTPAQDAVTLSLAKLIWTQKQSDFQVLARVMNDGPLQMRDRKDPHAGGKSLMSQEHLERCLTRIGIYLAADGDFASARTAMDLSIRYSNFAMAAARDSTDYLIAGSMASDSDAGLLRVALLQNCPWDLCQHWLSELPATEPGDTVLAQTMIHDFQGLTLRALADSEGLASTAIADLEPDDYDVDAESGAHPQDKEVCGTYDPLETTRLAASICALNVKNAAFPLSMYDAAPDRVEATQARGMPRFKGSGLKPGWPLTWEELKFKFAMNNGKNTLGRWLLSQVFGGSGKEWVRSSCTRRAKREVTRIALATVVYRHDRSGKLPETLADLVPKYLPAVPIDPFNGKPMLYSAAREKVWSVGENLVDDGGEFSTRTYPVKDVGASVALTQPHQIAHITYVRPPALAGSMGPPGMPGSKDSGD